MVNGSDMFHEEVLLDAENLCDRALPNTTPNTCWKGLISVIARLPSLARNVQNHVK